MVDIATFPWTPRYGWPYQVQCVAERFASSVGRPDAAAAIARHIAPVVGPRVVSLAEVIGLEPKRLQTTIDWARATCASCGSEPGQDGVAGTAEATPMRVGLSPHAPYSLLWLSGFLAQIESLFPKHVVAMHVAESREELEYLQGGAGPFADLWSRLGFPIPRRRPSIDEVIDWLTKARWALLAHGNYLSPEQIDAVAQSPSMSVVFCPRTHRHFRHAPYPLERMRRRGVRVLLGTDSRASNPDLNLWAEVRECRQRHPECDPKWALDVVTRQAAEALGVERDFGTLSVGRYAFCNSVSADPRWTVDTLLEAITITDVAMRPVWYIPDPSVPTAVQ